jgi:hypothetical protein
MLHSASVSRQKPTIRASGKQRNRFCEQRQHELGWDVNHSGISEMSTRLRQVGRDSGDGADFVVARLVSELGLAESL